MAHAPAPGGVPSRWRDLHPAARVATVILGGLVLLLTVGCGARILEWVIDGVAALTGDPTRC